MNNYKFETRAIHDGQEPDTETGAVIPPIHLSSTFKQEEVGKHKGFEYSRTGNPTRARLEKQVASLEGGEFGVAFASGSAATATIQLMLHAGDHVISGDDVYGGTYRFFDKVMRRFGLSYDFVDLTKPQAILEVIRPETKMLWLETPTNPLLKVANLQKLGQLAREHNLTTVVDNTFATPFLQNPLKHGIDLVLHSATKYLGGHSDLVGGVVVTSKPELAERIRFLQNSAGAVPSPFDCWLLSRGIKTLAVRMERHSQSALKIAQVLSDHQLVERVYYPFLGNHPNQDVALEQMRMGGGMVSFDLPSEGQAKAFLKHLRLFTLAESLGGVESLAEYPPTMTHGSIEPERRHEIGINDGLVRLSVGLENVDDLLEDIRLALQALS